MSRYTALIDVRKTGTSESTVRIASDSTPLGACEAALRKIVAQLTRCAAREAARETADPPSPPSKEGEGPRQGFSSPKGVAP